MDIRGRQRGLTAQSAGPKKPRLGGPHGEQVHSNQALSCRLLAVYYGLCTLPPSWAMGCLGQAHGSRTTVGIRIKIPSRWSNLNPLPTPGNPDFSRSGKSAAEFAQEPSQFARMAPGPSTRRGRLHWLRRRPGSGSRPELFWPWPAKGAASAPLKPPQASGSTHGVWLNHPTQPLERPSR